MPSSAVVPWPSALVGSPAIAVIERAIERQRLSHSILLHGDDIDTVGAIALAIADRLLSTPSKGGQHHFPPDQHPDCFMLRPAGKTRIINVESMRKLIGKVQVTAAVSRRKVAIVHEADRMNLPAANIFLKTLEEPPANTTLLLVTTHPYALIPTIRSRVLHFRFPGSAATSPFAGAKADLHANGSAKEGEPSEAPPGGTNEGPSPQESWSAWIADYRSWLVRLSAGVADKRALSEHIFTVYGLVARFDAILEAATAEAWKMEKERLPPDLEDDEQIAIETGIAKGLRDRLFAGIERATRDHAVKSHTSNLTPQTSLIPPLLAAIGKLEHGAGLFRYNLNESAVLEDFLLSSLRVWTGR